MIDRQGSEPAAHREGAEMTLVSVRIPNGDLEALRTAASATGRPVAHLIRRGIGRELAELRRDPAFVTELRARRDELDKLVSDLEEVVGVLDADDTTVSHTSQP